MAAKIYDIMKVAVTGGDAIENNRIKGKSNTGTYFICSSKDWDKFSRFFSENIKYYLDIKRVSAYKTLFIEHFFRFKDLFPDRMRHFEDICDSLLCYEYNPEIFISLRNNDVRVFMRFKDNNREVEYALRGILYSNFSNLVFEYKGNKCLIYPEINLEETLTGEGKCYE